MREWEKRNGAGATLGFAAGAVAFFHLAYAAGHAQVLFVGFFYCLFRLANARSGRRAFFAGLAVGLAIYAPHLLFFWSLFQAGAISLWMVLSCWLGLFLLLGYLCLTHFGLGLWAGAAPFFWMGLEFFRSELYYLRFSWLNAGYAFSTSEALAYMAGFGVYGIGFVLIVLAVILAIFRQLGSTGRIVASALAVLLLVYPSHREPRPRTQYDTQLPLRLTGVQLEFPTASQCVLALDKALKAFPDTDLFVLSEYAFTSPVAALARNWCRKNHRYLVAGGEDPLSGPKYCNTAFVIGPEGGIVFQQGKCVPVQLMKDGEPAREQHVWESPWGRLGFGLCYDASYTRVTDALIRQGAQLLVFPTMDVVDWGPHEHRLHARIAPMRAAEYGVPVFRLCSSGISQCVDENGHLLARAPFPGDGEILSAQLRLPPSGYLPPDRRLANFSVGFTLVGAVLLALEGARQRMIISMTGKK